MSDGHQMDVFEVLADIEENGLVPGKSVAPLVEEPVDPIDIITDCGQVVRIAGEGEPDLPEPVVVRAGYEWVVLVEGKRANERPLWSQIEAWAFIDGLRARP